MYQRARPYAEHRASTRHVVELDHAISQNERMMIRQRHDAGAEPVMARASGRAGDEHLGTGDDLETAGMVLADPGLVIVQPVEMLEQFHIAFERERRVYFEILKWSEENAAA
jgi:hypothetical protein